MACDSPDSPFSHRAKRGAVSGTQSVEEGSKIFFVRFVSFVGSVFELFRV
jgi:hypothetical protein